MNDKHAITEKLLDIDAQRAASGAGAAPRDRDLQHLFERPLASVGWLPPLFMCAGGLAGAILCGALLITEPAGMPVRTRIALLALTGVGLFWAALGGWIFRRGGVDSRVQGALAARMGFAFSLLSTVALGAMLLLKPQVDPATGALLLLLAPLVLATVLLVVHELRQAELRTRLKLLEVEYRLARMLDAQRPGQPQA